jgi:hypothetical protein
MRLRAHRRSLMVWSLSVGPADRHGALRFTRPALAVRPRWPLPAGMVLAAVSGMLLSGAWRALLVLGHLFLWSALVIPASPDAGPKRRSELERELRTNMAMGPRNVPYL